MNRTITHKKMNMQSLGLIPLFIVIIIFCTSCSESKNQHDTMTHITANVVVTEKSCDIEECWIIGEVSKDELIKIYIDKESTWGSLEINKLYTLSFTKEEKERVSLQEVVQ